GELFPWAELAVSGIGQWPTGPGDALDADAAKAALSIIGYLMDEPSDLTSTVIAFQRRYRPKQLNGRLDDETCRLIAAVARTLDIDLSANPG
ncbi:MAG: hypothetical protein AAGF19_05980, partial [Pseudomonadota bacterium]